MSGPPSYPDFCQPGASSHLASAYTVPSDGHPAVFGSQAPQPEPQFSYAQPNNRANSLLAELTLVDARKLTAVPTPHSYHGRSRMILSSLCKPSKTLLEIVEMHGLFLPGSDTTQHLARSVSLMRDLVDRPPSSTSAFCESFMACASELCQVQVDLQLHQQTRIQDKTEALHTALRNISRDLEPVQTALRRATWAPPETQTHMSASSLTAYLQHIKEQCGLPDPKYEPRDNDRFIVTSWEGTRRVAIARLDVKGVFYPTKTTCVRYPQRKGEIQYPPDLGQVCSSCSQGHFDLSDKLCVTLPYAARTIPVPAVGSSSDKVSAF